MTAKYKLFFNNLITVLNRYDNADIKSAIGDSTNNNRTATVSQVIRFLSSRRNTDLKALGYDLSVAYEAVRDDLTDIRSSTNRTDAFDINEFIDTYNSVVVVSGDVELRRTLGKQFTI